MVDSPFPCSAEWLLGTDKLVERMGCVSRMERYSFSSDSTRMTPSRVSTPWSTTVLSRMAPSVHTNARGSESAADTRREATGQQHPPANAFPCQGRQGELAHPDWDAKETLAQSNAISATFATGHCFHSTTTPRQIMQGIPPHRGIHGHGDINAHHMQVQLWDKLISI